MMEKEKQKTDRRSRSPAASAASSGTARKQEKKMTQDQIRLALIKKKKCEEQALKIVYELIEAKVDPSWLLENLKYISRCHMEDVIEERAISKICGYVLCQQPLQIVIKQKYHISLKDKKVYDMTKRKNFCSSSCYGASNFLLEQMLTGPLWIRDKEEIPEFKILKKGVKNNSKPFQEEVDISVIPKDSMENELELSKVENSSSEDPKKNLSNQSDNKNNENKSKELLKQELSKEIDNFVFGTMQYFNDKKEKLEGNSGISKSIETEKKELRERLINELGKDFNQELKKEIFSSSVKQELQIVEKLSSENQIQSEDSKNKKLAVIEKIIDNNILTDNKLEERLEISDHKKISSILDKDISDSCVRQECLKTNNQKKPTEKKTSIFKQKKLKTEKSKKVIDNKTPNLNIALKIEQNFREWFTEETTQFLFGDDSYKQEVIDRIEHQEKYSILCEKLDRLQFQEDQEDDEILEEKPNLKPLPHFEVLKEEGKKLELKVRAFYEGKTTFEERETTIEEGTNISPQEKNLDEEPVLPLLEGHTPQALRRKIFLEQLDKTIPELLKILSANNYHYTKFCSNYTSLKSSTVKALVRTFSLSSKNVVFKSVEWTLVGLIIIKMLSIVDPVLNNLLNSKQANLYISMILTSYQLDINYLNFFIDSLNPNVNLK